MSTEYVPTILDALMDAQDTDVWWLIDSIRTRLTAIGVDPDMPFSEFKERMGLA